ncbi:MAG: 4'-phosphopantetheinyl transferase family protein [Candidatus Gallimonas sp.]
MSILNARMLNDDSLYGRALGMVSDFRRDKAESYRLRKDRNLSLAAGLLLAEGLRRLGVPERECVYALSAHGKPYFANAPEIRFSLSHSGDYALLALSDGEVGCDLEKMRAVDMRLCGRAFSPADLALLDGAAEKEETFFRLWTRRESLVKATGEGVFSHLSVGLGEKVNLPAEWGGACYVKEYPAPSGYKIACCAFAPRFCDRVRDAGDAVFTLLG